MREADLTDSQSYMVNIIKRGVAETVAMQLFFQDRANYQVTHSLVDQPHTWETISKGDRETYREAAKRLMRE